MTAFGYLRLTLADARDPARLERDRAAGVAAQAEYLARGYSAGEIVTDEPEQLRKAVAARPGGFRVGRLAKPGDVILTPSAGRLARSVAELRETFERWHHSGVAGVVLDLPLDYSTPEARAALAIMAAGASLDRSINRSEKLSDMTADQLLTVNRWGLAVTPKTRKATVVPAEFDLACRCAAWHLGGASYYRITLHLTRIREPLPVRWKKRNRTRFGPAPFWQVKQVRTMIRSYHVVTGLLERGSATAPAGYVVPTATPTPLPQRSNP
jgi:hypothetical protein